MPKRFTRRKCIAAIGAAMLPRSPRAQQKPPPTIGILDSAAATAAKLSTFYEGLKVEGFSKNDLMVEYRSAGGDYARLPELAAGLLDRRVTLITAFGSPAALAAKTATAKTPIVIAVNANPIEIGLVDNLNYSGRNATGVVAWSSSENTGVWNCCTRRSQAHLCLDFSSILRIRTEAHKSTMLMRPLRS